MYQVFCIESIGAPRNHRAIFVELDATAGSGNIFQVTGNIQEGMMYEVKQNLKPEESHEFLTKIFLGWVDRKDYSRINDICCSIPPPKKQFEKNKRLYPGEPLRRCQEWTREVIQAFENEGILRQTLV